MTLRPCRAAWALSSRSLSSRSLSSRSLSSRSLSSRSLSSRSLSSRALSSRALSSLPRLSIICFIKSWNYRPTLQSGIASRFNPGKGNHVIRKQAYMGL